jgi:hypothetical protein
MHSVGTPSEISVKYDLAGMSWNVAKSYKSFQRAFFLNNGRCGPVLNSGSFVEQGDLKFFKFSNKSSRIGEIANW